MNIEITAKRDGNEIPLSNISAATFEKLKAEKEKSKELGHGDWGGEKGNRWIKIYDKIWWLDGCQKFSSSLPDSDFIENHPRKGNFVDDLERNSKDLEEFTHDRTTYILKDDGRIDTKHEGECNWMLNHPEATHQLLGQLIATAKRREAKKDC